MSMFIVFDLDDTLSDTTHRQFILEQEFETDSEKWNAFFDACLMDTPNVPIVKLLDTLAASTNNHRIEIWTGRGEQVREKTLAWLNQHTQYFKYSFINLRMRPEGDFRPDTEIKAEWMQQHGSPDIVFDDRNKMVNWWREQGITCCQVKESDF